MSQVSRRRFLKHAASAGLVAPLTAAEMPVSDTESSVPLNGAWWFRLDPQQAGEAHGWHLAGSSRSGWKEVEVPHTWQIAEESAGYQGMAWYSRSFDVPSSWAGKVTRVEFEAVFHSAVVWVNGKPVGEHSGKGYTAFLLDISSAIRPGARNFISVKVDNSFDPHMLPRDNSYDWTQDGGLIRPVRLIATPPTFVERVEVDALPDLAAREATLNIRAVVRNASGRTANIGVGYQVCDDETGLVVLQQSSRTVSLPPGATQLVELPSAKMSNPRLWHFDRPHLYRLGVKIEQQGSLNHECVTSFGVRKIELRGTTLYLNGERVRLMGVERMAGSNPEFGMAEPASWIGHDHDDMKELNCVFTRVHWQQDRRVLDYCDRHGILVQVEVPAWGPRTFHGMRDEPSPEILQNGLEQLREMIHRDRNHPCVFSWGLCNEVNGQNPPARKFALRLYEEAKKLNPDRLVTHASNSLRKTIDRDVAGNMDFIMWNEYYGSWQQGDVETVKRNLEEIHHTFPNKMIVISEYGFCECRPQHTGGDSRRIEILREHTRAFRDYDFVGGAIFFCYNDYRTHIGDKGIGALKQRVHGVVDVYGVRKPSFEELRRESSPLDNVQVKVQGSSLTATVVARHTLPAYTLDGYKLRCVVHGFDGLPMERREVALPRLKPGEQTSVSLVLQETNPTKLRIDIIRPTGFSAWTSWVKV